MDIHPSSNSTCGVDRNFGHVIVLQGEPKGPGSHLQRDMCDVAGELRELGFTLSSCELPVGHLRKQIKSTLPSANSTVSYWKWHIDSTDLHKMVLFYSKLWVYQRVALLVEASMLWQNPGPASQGSEGNIRNVFFRSSFFLAKNKPGVHKYQQFSRFFFGCWTP